MSFELTRRSFLKYSALTAVAVAGSGLLTGCNDNPYQPVGKPGDTLELMGKHTLVKYRIDSNGILFCDFSIYCSSDRNLSVLPKCFQVDVTNAAGVKKTCRADNMAEFALTDSIGDLKKKETFETTLRVVYRNFAEGDTIEVKYWPRPDASLGYLGYTDAFCTWKWTYDPTAIDDGFDDDLEDEDEDEDSAAE